MFYLEIYIYFYKSYSVFNCFMLQLIFADSTIFIINK